MTIKDLRKYFWLHIATDDMKSQFSSKKSQNDYSPDTRALWIQFVDFARRDGMITENQERNATL